jgi:predicted patatin/cPLA2 family phospholipase
MMHSTLKNIKARKNKKGPHNDGRKIVLVIYGGTMSSVRTGGALLALEEMGLRNSFDEVYTVSGGFPCASYFLSGQVNMVLAILYKHLSNSKFINFFRLWRIMNIDYAIDIIKSVRPLSVSNLFANPTKLYVGLFDPEIDHTEYLEIHNFDELDYFELLKASVSVPYLCPGEVRVRGKLYEDMPFKKYYHLHHVENALASGATDVLVIYNYHDQRKFKKKLPKHVYEIRPDRSWELSRFETNETPLKEAARQMGAYVKKLFDEEGEIQLLD